MKRHRAGPFGCLVVVPRIAAAVFVAALVPGGLVVTGCGSATGEPIILGGRTRGTLTDGLIGYWKLDESTPDEPVLDSSGQGHHGTPVNGPSPSSLLAPVRIPNDASRTFDGVSQYIDLGNPGGLDFGGPITLAAWVKLRSLPESCNVILSHGFRYNPSAEIALRGSRGLCDGPGNSPNWAVGAFDGANHFAEVAISPDEVGSWVNLIGTFDGQTWRLYRNGAEVAVQASTVGPFPIDASWGIGGRAPVNPTTNPRLLDGYIDEVRLYDRALSPSEVLDLYNL